MKAKEATIDVVEFNVGKADFYLVGRTPIILNRMSEKAKHTLLMPKGRMTAADKARNVKHNPYQEFRDSPYTNPDKSADTYLEHLSTAFKAAIRGAGLDVPGATKSQLGRLLWVEGERVSLYGVPKLFMSVTRSADMNKTPDVRTRTIIKDWACKISVSFVQPMLNIKTVSNLLAAAGLTQGIGDWRPEKGSGNYGQFILAEANDKALKERFKVGYQQQFEAMQNPVPYDQETEELLAWFDEEADRRGLKVVGG